MLGTAAAGTAVEIGGVEPAFAACERVTRASATAGGLVDMTTPEDRRAPQSDQTHNNKSAVQRTTVRTKCEGAELLDTATATRE